MSNISNGEILYLYDAALCNPNGDPDDENRPRMDYVTQTNLVSDVRLKRYIRDYLHMHKGMDIFVAQQEGKSVDATHRIVDQLKLNKNPQNLSQDQLDQLKEDWIDIRLFGAVFPIKAGKDSKSGGSDSFTGPVQFSWGYSLNKVSLVDSPSITSVFSGKTEGHGNIGKDYRVNYSLIGFYGAVVGKYGEMTGLKPEDLNTLDKAMVEAIPMSATRSKIGQKPRFYLRIQYKKDNTRMIGDLRELVTLQPVENEESRRGIADVQLDFTRLGEKLKMFKDKIDKVYIWQDEELKDNFTAPLDPGSIIKIN